MTAASLATQRVIDTLGLPAAAIVGQRVPKTLLIEHGAPTAADRRLIETGVDELRWVACLKPNSVGIASFEDGLRQCLELIVMTLTIRPDGKISRLVELVHRAIPYHLLLVTAPPGESDPLPTLSVADKRWSQSESRRVVLDGEIVSTDLALSTSSAAEALLASLPVARRPHPHLYAVYRSWHDSLLAAEAARKTGAFADAASSQHAAERQAALTRCTALEKEIATIRQAAAKERQMARQVDLNLRLKRLSAELADARSRL